MHLKGLVLKVSFLNLDSNSLIKLNHAITNNKIEVFLNGDSHIQLNELKLNGRSAWDANLPVIKEEVTQPTVQDGNNSIITKNKRFFTILKELFFYEYVYFFSIVMSKFD